MPLSDNKQWASAWARFQAYRKNLPSFFDEEKIQNYHSIVQDLSIASGEFLNDFRIPSDRIKPKAVSVRRAPYGGGHGSVQYSSKKYCDTEFAKQQIEALFHYLREWEMKQDKTSPLDDKDYWSMDDSQLEKLANKYHIPPISRTGPEGQHWYIDRDRIIEALVKRDNALLAGSPAPPTNIMNIGEMHGSVAQQGMNKANVSIHFEQNDPALRDLLAQIREAADKLTLSHAARQQLATDAQTIQVQLASSHPKSSIITESLHSVRAILEGITGSIIASGILYEIAKMLGHK